jgi:hypothetical protein
LAAVQVVPESVSATGLVPLPEKPTATHEAAEMHETLVKDDSVWPEGSGRLAAVHVLPDRISATGVGVLLSVYPTATHAVAVVHEIPNTPVVV